MKSARTERDDWVGRGASRLVRGGLAGVGIVDVDLRPVDACPVCLQIREDLLRSRKILFEDDHRDAARHFRAEACDKSANRLGFNTFGFERAHDGGGFEFAGDGRQLDQFFVVEIHARLPGAARVLELRLSWNAQACAFFKARSSRGSGKLTFSDRKVSSRTSARKRSTR